MRVLALGHPVPKANGPSQGIQQQLNASKATLTLNLREREREREKEREGVVEVGMGWEDGRGRVERLAMTPGRGEGKTRR